MSSLSFFIVRHPCSWCERRERTRPVAPEMEPHRARVSDSPRRRRSDKD
jgi:hypothetical protein